MKDDRLLIARCSLSMGGLVHYLRWLSSSMKSTNLITSHNHHLSLQTLSLTQVSNIKTPDENVLSLGDAYDVNVSPDKRTILLYEQSALLDSLRVVVSHHLVVVNLMPTDIPHRASRQSRSICTSIPATVAKVAIFQTAESASRKFRSS